MGNPWKQMKASKCPTDELSLSNCAIVNSKDFDAQVYPHIEVSTGEKKLYFTVKNYDKMELGSVGFSMPQRRWANLSLSQEITVSAFVVKEQRNIYIGKLSVTVDFVTKKSATTDAFDTDKMKEEFVMLFASSKLIVSVGQELVFPFTEKTKLLVNIREIHNLSSDSGKSVMRQAEFGIIHGNSAMTFDAVEGSSIRLVGKSKGQSTYQSVIPQEWDFTKMGIGGLDKEFADIFRRAFASRVFPPDLVEQLGVKHVRGMLLYGPPGTGKTLIAREIGKMLNAREPKIVNGPEILDKYVGETEANVRKLFADAEAEQKRCGNQSGLHIIILDEIDAICKARGSVQGGTAVHDTVVNQLLSKIDGVDELNNILVIGMTNRKDMIDDALLRPGRLEVQMEIGLPDEHGRVQILNIHTMQIKQNNKLAPDVDLKELAENTKNFSGAELAGLVRSAASTAMNRLIKATTKIELDPDATEKLNITRDDFLKALQDIKPAFGSSNDDISSLIVNGVVNWGEPFKRVIEDGELLLRQAVNSDKTPLVTVLLDGAPQSGKTALAAKLACDSLFPFMRVCTPERMIGYTESAKAMAIKQVFEDAYKSPVSLIIMDDIERLLDYAPIGPRFSNLVLQTLLVLLKKLPPKGRKLMVICTTSRKDVLRDLEMLNTFSAVIRVPSLRSRDHLISALEGLESFTEDEMAELNKKLATRERSEFFIGIKKLLTLVEMAKQTDSSLRVNKFLSLLDEDEE